MAKHTLFILTPDEVVVEMDAAGMTLFEIQNVRYILQSWGCRTTFVQDYADEWRGIVRCRWPGCKNGAVVPVREQWVCDAHTDAAWKWLENHGTLHGAHE